MVSKLISKQIDPNINFLTLVSDIFKLFNLIINMLIVDYVSSVENVIIIIILIDRNNCSTVLQALKSPQKLFEIISNLYFEVLIFSSS